MCSSGYLSIPLIVPVGQSAQQQPALPAQHLGHIWGSQGNSTSSQPKGSPWQEPSMSSGEELLGFNERARGRMGQSQTQPSCCLATGVGISFTGWVEDITWGGGNSSVLIRVGHWSTTCPLCEWLCPKTQRAEPQQPPPAPSPAQAATDSTRHRSPLLGMPPVPLAPGLLQVIQHFNYINCIKQSCCWNHGLGLKHHLITPTNCSLTLCLTLTSQRELPAQHLLSQQTHCQARSSHLLINCSSCCCSPNEGSLRSLPAPGSSPLPGIQHQAWTQRASSLSWLLEPGFGPFSSNTMHKGNLARAERTGTKPQKTS